MFKTKHQYFLLKIKNLIFFIVQVRFRGFVNLVLYICLLSSEIVHKIIYCTYNFTPTQFIYLDKVNIPMFKNMPDLSYKGIHCEVGLHVVIENELLLKLFEENIDMIKKRKETIQVK